MAGSVKQHFKSKYKNFGRPDRAVKDNVARWDRWGERASSLFSSPKAPESGPVIPMADEEEIRRNRRRSNAARGGGRSSTILTGGDEETLG